MISISLLALATASFSDTLTIPAYTAFIEPDPVAAEVERVGVTHWVDPKQSVVWYGKINTKGTLSISVKVNAPTPKSNFAFQFDGKTLKPVGTLRQDPSVILDFGTVKVNQVGRYHRFALQNLVKDNRDLGQVESMMLSGSALENSEFNLTERRNAASVHIRYPLPKEDQVEWFYNEVNVKTTPLHSFYMACGFHRGYFGIQVNSPSERRVIYSLWDSGDEAVDRDKVQQADRVQLLEKGPGVIASSFGNEGTGGHSHLVYPWEQGQTYRFLLHAEPAETTTTYTAYFRAPKGDKWSLIASFRAPKDGGYLKGLHSFNENFWGTNGNMQRLALYGPAWVRLKGGIWKELTAAQFTHDGHGLKNRRDYSLRVAGPRYALSNGGFVGDVIRLGDTKDRKPTNRPPKIGMFGF